MTFGTSSDVSAMKSRDSSTLHRIRANEPLRLGNVFMSENSGTRALAKLDELEPKDEHLLPKTSTSLTMPVDLAFPVLSAIQEHLFVVLQQSQLGVHDLHLIGRTEGK